MVGEYVVDDATRDTRSRHQILDATTLLSNRGSGGIDTYIVSDNREIQDTPKILWSLHFVVVIQRTPL
jgi:hypothetical protein